MTAGAARSGRPRGGGFVGLRPPFKTILIFLLPASIVFAIFVLGPVSFSAYTSFFEWNGRGSITEFVGLDNFRRLAGDEIFRGDLFRGGMIILLSLVVQLPFAFGLAMLLHQKFPGRTIFRLIFFVPYVLSEAVTAVLFTLLLSPSRGAVNQFLSAIGFGDVEILWMADRNLVLYTVFAVLCWKYFGFYMILFLAGRQNIPQELYEAAKVDGATAVEQFRRITLPLMGPTVRVTVFLSVIGVVQLFDLVYILTSGGPGHSSETMAITMYDYGFQRNEVGYGSAISIVMFLICLIFALLYQRYVLKRDLQGSVAGAAQSEGRN
ncbi:carbohydrate ABC transporter permease [Glycomyces xiaoerkulensis]|uniref:carbohydrate ABC transporter permease n=1 Tax=Glycomyces xiaoerkulensis TaxID=2038139 RepID=UPI0018E428C7|nr:sugar ABC transporter permease [Glycomyces xiaoerkulensis]